MYRVLTALLMLGVAWPALASPIGATSAPPKSAGPAYVNPGGPRQGGDTIASALVIDALPLHDTGTTAGYINDYDEVCPYSGSTAPDVVYSFVATADGCVKVDLCPSGYDTKVYVYENTVGNLVDCNDDAGCVLAYRSRIDELHVAEGNTYYIVIDGYAGETGTYDLTVDSVQCWIPEGPCWVPGPSSDCSTGALTECEPSCGDGYVDNHNGGCDGGGWTLIEGQSGTGDAMMCGKSCTFLHDGVSDRDTDWYEFVAVGGWVCAEAVAEFDLEIALIHGPAGGVIDCSNYTMEIATAPANQGTGVGYNFAGGTTGWFRIAPSAFTGVPESGYRFILYGIQNGSTPVYTGACCDIETSACTIDTDADCTGLYMGNCTSCEPSPCPPPPPPPPPSGACCFPAGNCGVLNQAVCEDAGGAYMGDHTPCSPGICDQTPTEVKSWGAVKNLYR